MADIPLVGVIITAYSSSEIDGTYVAVGIDTTNSSGEFNVTSLVQDLYYKHKVEKDGYETFYYGAGKEYDLQSGDGALMTTELSYDHYMPLA